MKKLILGFLLVGLLFVGYDPPGLFPSIEVSALPAEPGPPSGQTCYTFSNGEVICGVPLCNDQASCTENTEEKELPPEDEVADSEADKTETTPQPAPVDPVTTTTSPDPPPTEMVTTTTSSATPTPPPAPVEETRPAVVNPDPPPKVPETVSVVVEPDICTNYPGMKNLPEGWTRSDGGLCNLPPPRAGYCDPKTRKFYDLARGQDKLEPYASMNLVDAYADPVSGSISCDFPKPQEIESSVSPQPATPASPRPVPSPPKASNPPATKPIPPPPRSSPSPTVRLSSSQPAPKSRSIAPAPSAPTAP